jgi:hypothetical protein
VESQGREWEKERFYILTAFPWNGNLSSQNRMGVSIETSMQINGKGVETEETVKVKAEERG